MNEKLQKLIATITKLPGIGPRHAMRIVLALLDWKQEEVSEFGSLISGLTQGPILCKKCYNFADSELCLICLSPSRDQNRIAVVERVTDLASMEKAGVYKGLYHVLGGAINPVIGMVPEKLKIRELINRISSHPQSSMLEIIIATNPNTYGETTALFLEQNLRKLGVTITRLARGLASGTTLEYADEMTLANAFKNRK